jgi:hypothetical protein
LQKQRDKLKPAVVQDRFVEGDRFDKEDTSFWREIPRTNKEYREQVEYGKRCFRQITEARLLKESQSFALGDVAFVSPGLEAKQDDDDDDDPEPDELPKTRHEANVEFLENLFGRLELETKQAQLRMGFEERGSLSTNLQRDIDNNTGDACLKRIRRTINSLSYAPSFDQKRFQQAFIRAALPRIYGSAWEHSAERVMAELEIDEIRAEVMVQTARRMGKTEAVAMYILAMMDALPGLRVLVFSTGKRASGNLMQTLMDHMGALKGGKERILKQNQEQLWFGPEGCGSSSKNIDQRLISRFYSLPAGTSSQSYTHISACCLFGLHRFRYIVLVGG